MDDVDDDDDWRIDSLMSAFNRLAADGLLGPDPDYYGDRAAIIEGALRDVAADRDALLQAAKALLQALDDAPGMTLRDFGALRILIALDDAVGGR